MIKANKILNILQVGWGWPPNQKGGVVYYTKSLITGLAKKGHRIHYFYTGDRSLLFFSYVKHKNENGVKLTQLVNSPNYYNSKFNKLNSELENKYIEKEFIKVLDMEKPDIVHIQNFAGLCASIALIAKNKGYLVVNSMHNYMPICPYGELFNYSTQKICKKNGCVSCYVRESPLKQKIMRTATTLIHNLPSIFKSLIPRSINLRQSTTKISYFEKLRISKLRKSRLTFFKKVLIAVDINLAVSSIVKKIYHDYLGIPDSKIIVNHAGIEGVRYITAKRRSNEVVTFIFLGSLDAHKGFQNLLEAYKKIDQKKARLLVYAPIDKKYSALISGLEKKYSVEFNGAYSLDDLPNILSKADVGIVPPIWHDNAPRVVFEMQAAKLPLIISNIGGMMDFVKDKYNGRVFQFDDINDLANKLTFFVTNPSVIKKFQNNIRPAKTMDEHVNEIEELYYELIKDVFTDEISQKK